MRPAPAALLLLLAACNRTSPEKPAEPPAGQPAASGEMGGVAGFLKGLVSGGQQALPAPPRVVVPTDIPATTSTVSAPIQVPLSELERALDRAIPTTLWQIDQREDRCVAPARIRGVAVTPRLSCRIVGEVTRGPIRLGGRGADIRLRMPVSATVSAREVARILNETATASADVEAVVRLTMGNDWNPRGTVQIAVDWKEPPGINFLGIRIGFASRADPKLQKLIADLERQLPAELAKLGVRRQVEKIWADGFTTIELNRHNPAAWMRVTPQQLGFGGYDVQGRQISARINLQARTETFLAEERPAPLAATPLPPPATIAAGQGFHFRIPVVAHYEELVPVLEKALNKLAKKGIDAPVVGRVDVQFGTPVIYTTQNGRLAIGLDVKASRNGGMETGGMVWLTGHAVNEPNSQLVKVQDLTVYGSGENATGNLLLQVAQAPAVIDLLQDELTQNFSNDFGKLRVKIDKALTDKRIGDFVLNTRIREVRHGVVLAVGQGLFLPVEALGEARLDYRPRPRNQRR